jgi:hypothetical protein
VLLEEDQSQPLGRRYLGYANWRTREIEGRGGTRFAVEAKIEIPERHLTTYVSVAPKDGGASSLTYIIQVFFAASPEFMHQGISSVSALSAKPQQASRGVILASHTVKIEPNHFLIVLSSVDAERQLNFKLLKEGAWFDISITYGDGLRAIVAVEKGPIGARAFQSAFSVWR